MQRFRSTRRLFPSLLLYPIQSLCQQLSLWHFSKIYTSMVPVFFCLVVQREFVLWMQYGGMEFGDFVNANVG